MPVTKKKVKLFHVFRYDSSPFHGNVILRRLKYKLVNFGPWSPQNNYFRAGIASAPEKSLQYRFRNPRKLPIWFGDWSCGPGRGWKESGTINIIWFKAKNPGRQWQTREVKPAASVKLLGWNSSPLLCKWWTGKNNLLFQSKEIKQRVSSLKVDVDCRYK